MTSTSPRLSHPDHCHAEGLLTAFPRLKKLSRYGEIVYRKSAYGKVASIDGVGPSEADTVPKTIFGSPHSLFVEALIAARRRAGLNQTELGARLGKDQKFISLIERSQRRIDVVEWLAVCRAIGVDPVDLYQKVSERVGEAIDI